MQGLVACGAGSEATGSLCCQEVEVSHASGAGGLYPSEECGLTAPCTPATSSSRSLPPLQSVAAGSPPALVGTAYLVPSCSPHSSVSRNHWYKTSPADQYTISTSLHACGKVLPFATPPPHPAATGSRSAPPYASTLVPDIAPLVPVCLISAGTKDPGHSNLA